MTHLHHLLYGRERLAVRFPQHARVTVIRKPKMPLVAQPRQAVLRAIESPITAKGEPSESFDSVATAATSACIAICDITRPVPNALFLRPLIETIHHAGIPLSRITVIVATGLHRPNVGKELEELVGDRWVLDNVDVVNHVARNDSEHVSLGSTRTRGTQVRLDRRFVEADLRIVTGLVEPHFMAGYSGGRKVIAPGLAHADTIRTFHNFAFMDDPLARNGNLTGNPLHEEQLEIVNMLGGTWALNTVIDEDRKLAFVNFGEVVASHRQAVQFVQEYCLVPVTRRFSTVVTSAAGYPLDKTYYQTVKGMVGALNILRPGGCLIVASRCEEGLGSPEFVASQRTLVGQGVEQFLDTIRTKQYADVDQWQTQMQTKAMLAGSIHLYSSLSHDDRRLTGLQTVGDLDQRIADCLESSGDPCVALIPEGPYVIPYRESDFLAPDGTFESS